MLLRLNQMLYALFLSYHSNTEAVLFTCILSGWATTMGRLFGSKVGNSNKCLSFPRTQRRATTSGISNQGFAMFRLLARCLYQLSYAAAAICYHFCYFCHLLPLLLFLPSLTTFTPKKPLLF